MTSPETIELAEHLVANARHYDINTRITMKTVTLPIAQALLDAEKQIVALEKALRALLALDVKGHAIADRLQFSDIGRALLEKATAALNKKDSSHE